MASMRLSPSSHLLHEEVEVSLAGAGLEGYILLAGENDFGLEVDAAIEASEETSEETSNFAVLESGGACQNPADDCGVPGGSLGAGDVFFNC